MYNSYYSSYRNPSYYRYPYYGDYYSRRYRSPYNSHWNPYSYWNDYFYGPDDEPEAPESPKPESPKPESPKPEPPKPETPEAPKEELAKVLKVEKVDYKIKENAKKHRTDKFAYTKTNWERDGKTMKPWCIVRRGDSMNMTIKFDRKYEKKKNHLTLKFTIGNKPLETKGTDVRVEIDEGDENDTAGSDKTYEPDEWGVNLKAIKGDSIDLELFIPSNCVIGKWKVFISTIGSGKDKDGNDTEKRFTYKDDKNGFVTILFNPWCKQDMVFIPEDQDEYVLNERGFVYTGNSSRVGCRSWLFGQFSDMILETCLKLLETGFNKHYRDMYNPVKVARVLAAMVNSQDENGVLSGNWSGNYEGGKKPTHWSGSVAILQQFFKTEKPVQWGQCWVFSGVLTSVCRCVGIPCRSVTNFDSAHDSDQSNTIDYIDWSGDDNFEGVDSVWNFHVWNEVYLKRLDLPDGFSGWQALDATPQETSDGLFTCGPTPIIAVKKGRVDIKYDVGFVFSEVNADKCYWKWQGDGLKEVRFIGDAVGAKISTKTPGFKNVEGESRYRRRAIGLSMRNDVTSEYKYPEGSDLERKAVEIASKYAQRPRARNKALQEDNDVRVNIDVGRGADDEIMIGNNLDITINVNNDSHNNSAIKVEKVVVSLFPELYTRERGGEAFMKQTFEVNQTLEKGKSTTLNKTVTYNEYFEHLMEECFVKILAVVHYRNEYTRRKKTVEEFHFAFDKPELRIEMLNSSEMFPTIGYKDEAKFKVSFTNPLPIPLTNCTISVESFNFVDHEDIKVPDVAAHGTFEYEMTTKSTREGDGELDFDFDSSELFNLKGEIDVQVATYY